MSSFILHILSLRLKMIKYMFDHGSSKNHPIDTSTTYLPHRHFCSRGVSYSVKKYVTMVTFLKVMNQFAKNVK